MSNICYTVKIHIMFGLSNFTIIYFVHEHENCYLTSCTPMTSRLYSALVSVSTLWLARLVKARSASTWIKVII